MSEKTHDPTPKRLRDARAKGDVPSAPLVAGAVGLLALAPLCAGAVGKLATHLAATMQGLAPVESIDPWAFASLVLAPTLPVVLVLGAIAVVSGIVQGSVTLSLGKLAPDPSRLEPFGGLGRLIDKSKLWGALRGTLIALALTALLGRLVFEAALLGARETSAAGRAIALASRLSTRIVFTAGALAAVVAVIDAIVARQLWLGRLKMSHDEVVREHKEGDGDPEVKRRREELHHELMAAEALTAVKDSTVLVINPTHLACALKYDAQGREGDEDAAPALTAKGHGALAARMIEAARASGVPVIRDVPVARALYDLELGVEIPEALYEAVAEVLRAAWDGEGD